MEAVERSGPGQAMAGQGLASPFQIGDYVGVVNEFLLDVLAGFEVRAFAAGLISLLGHAAADLAELLAVGRFDTGHAASGAVDHLGGEIRPVVGVVEFGQPLAHLVVVIDGGDAGLALLAVYPAACYELFHRISFPGETVLRVNSKFRTYNNNGLRSLVEIILNLDFLSRLSNKLVVFRPYSCLWRSRSVQTSEGMATTLANSTGRFLRSMPKELTPDLSRSSR